MFMSEKLKREYRESLKSADTEENIDLVLYRPLGFMWACFFRKLGVTPNVVTILSIFIGVGAGICMYPANLWINICGMLLLIWANSYDSADGQLARLTKQYSPLGRILDGMAGDFWFISIYMAICLRTNLHDSFFANHSWLIWTMAVAAGICHALQAATADRYRQFHLLMVKGSAGSELDSSTELRRRMLAVPWGKNPVKRLIATLYYGYTCCQEKLTPGMCRLRSLLEGCGSDGNIPADLAAEIRRQSFPLCKWENFMTFNWRSIFLFASLFAGQPWLYFAAELTVFNIVLVYTIVTHEAMCRRLCRQLEAKGCQAPSNI